ncbi:hypothetical protein [Paracoccus halophilus]|uniref:hypothetical protein n=1 Tax=Paracoccus halophilus TaxID=376733 RepID=UPI0011139B3A|nr:hypothetical protein [Paracoccus halophilus]
MVRFLSAATMAEITSSVANAETVDTTGIENFLTNFKGAFVTTDVSRRCDDHFVALQTVRSADFDLLFEVAKSRFDGKIDDGAARVFSYSAYLDILLQTYIAARDDDCIAEIDFSNQ